MEYYFYATNGWCDLDKIKPYIVQRYKNNTVCKVVFDDERYDDFAKAFDLAGYIEKWGDNIIFGTDGYYYNTTLNGAIKGEKYPAKEPEQRINIQLKMYKSYHSDSEFKEQVLKNSEHRDTEKILKGAFGFNKSLYIGEDKDFVMPYRFKKAKKKNQPLIVYIAGAGTIGHDNFNQFWEFLFYAGGNRVNKYDCNVLIPQYMRGNNKGDSENTLRERYMRHCISLIKQLVNDHDIDSNRIYIYGMSFGAGCVWNALLLAPELFAAASEAMGEHFFYKSLDKSDFQSISHIPIWMAHSSDDSAVNIASDDYFYKNLKALGANVKYTRWEKYGHAMASKFYKKEPWVEWIFEQSK